MDASKSSRVVDTFIGSAALTVAAGIALAAAASAVLAAASERRSDKAIESLLAVRIAAQSIEVYAEQHVLFPGPTDGLVPYRTLRETLGIRGARHLADRDAWNRPLYYWSNGRTYMIVSFGSDGQPDYPYDRQEIPYEGISPGVNLDDTQDIILVLDSILRGPTGHRSAPRRTMADMRSIGTACETYAIDNNFYPSSQGTVIPVSALAPHLAPTYIRILPVTDGWGEPYLYWSNLSSYMIISTGADAAADHPYETWTPRDFLDYPGGTFADLRRDILFRTGMFIQYPLGIVP